ncbi:hypothetical protein BRC64_11165 [Halobacteriales archaeon QH_10_67_22]|nr:MAG: hypothetical protein BRC64_11165 [Halobacteriales archaeon QH_10_67_22]
MNPKQLPVVGAVIQYGADDRVLDWILVLGPVVITSFVVFGRNAVTTGIVALYLLAFVAYLGYAEFVR